MMKGEIMTGTERNRDEAKILRTVWIVFNILLFSALSVLVVFGGIGTLMRGTFFSRTAEIIDGRESFPVYVGGCVEREGTYDLDLFSSYAQLLELAGVKEHSAVETEIDTLIDFTVPVVIVHCIEDGAVIRARNINSVSAEDLAELGLSPLSSARVISYREHNGSFQSKDELLLILDEREFDEIKFKVYAL
jgi:hypothetical protein